MRLPGSANLKPGKQQFLAHIPAEIDPEEWTLHELATALGTDLNALAIKDHVVSVDFKTGGAGTREGIDPLLDWLVDKGHVIQDRGEWVDIVCPWADQHTTGENTAGYSPLGRGKGDWVQRRTFNCLHEHCTDKRLFDLLKKWEGAPFVSGYDPLPWLQDHYVYVETDQRVVDLHQRPIGGRWVWSLADWTKRHPGKVRAIGHDKPVSVATAFIESRDTARAVDTRYTPVSAVLDTGLTNAYGQTYINTYVPPNWEPTSENPEVFLEHVTYLLPDPDHCELFLNWLAAKIQKPETRSYAIVMVAKNAQGTGRSWLKDILIAVLRGGVNTATMPQMYGKGYAEQTYNDWKSGCQFIVVEESKNNEMSREDYYNGYETFKLNCDTKVTANQRINPKFGRTRSEDLYYNVLIFSNHADAMAIPEEDRRICVLDNPSDRLDYKYYDRLLGALQTQEPRRVFWYLMRRDISDYDRIYPPMTKAKQRMIADTRAPSAVILEWIRDNHAADLVTRSSLKAAIVQGAIEFDHDRIMREPTIVSKLIWNSLESLRPIDEKNGARYVLNGKQTEVRALRRIEHWMDVDERRDKELVEAEYDKKEMVSNVFDLDSKRDK